MPNFARLRGLTYWSQLFVDMREQKILNDENGGEGDTVESDNPHVKTFIGRIPIIMLVRPVRRRRKKSHFDIKSRPHPPYSEMLERATADLHQPLPPHTQIPSGRLLRPCRRGSHHPPEVAERPETDHYAAILC